MRHGFLQQAFHVGAWVAVFLSGASRASADALPTSYTVTDLGPGYAKLSTDASGNGILIAPDGQTTYAFPRTDNSLTGSQAQAVMAEFPPFTNAPAYWQVTYGHPISAYSQFDPTTLFLNKNGWFVGTDNFGVWGHDVTAQSTALSAQRLPDGSFGPLTTLWESQANNTVGYGLSAEAHDLNNNKIILGSTYYSYGVTLYFICDLNSGRRWTWSPICGTIATGRRLPSPSTIRGGYSWKQP